VPGVPVHVHNRSSALAQHERRGGVSYLEGVVEMSRLAQLFVAGLALTAVGLIVIAAAPSAGGDAALLIGEAMLLLGCLLLGILAFVNAWKATRSPGWTRVANPGAAYREAKAEREALERRELEPGSTDGDEQGS
jgi:hypothetical protein